MATKAMSRFFRQDECCLLALALTLPLGRDCYLDHKSFAWRADPHAGDRGGVTIAEARRDADVAGVGANIVGRIESYPAEAGDMCLGPGVGCCLLVLAFHHQIAGDVTGRDLQCTGAGEEDMGVVLADAALCL